MEKKERVDNMKKIIVMMVVFALVVGLAPLYAKPIGKAAKPASMSQLKIDAINEIKAGGQLMKRADSLMRNYATPETLRAAVRLYTSAGTLFDSAQTKLASLQGTSEATGADVNNARVASLRCQTMVKQIQSRLAVLAPSRV